MLLSSKFYGREARFLQLSKDLFKVSSKITVMIIDFKQFIDKVCWLETSNAKLWISSLNLDFILVSLSY